MNQNLVRLGKKSKNFLVRLGKILEILFVLARNPRFFLFALP